MVSLAFSLTHSTNFLLQSIAVSTRMTDKMIQSALFNFQSLLLVLLLLICTCTYVRGTAPGIVDRNREG